MDENLVGYLMDALDADAKREVEESLRSNPEAGKKLVLLRKAIEPLAADREEIAAPPDLRARTLAIVADYRIRNRPRPPQAPPVRSAVVTHPSWWRRADVLVAASLLLVGFPLVFSWIASAQRQRSIVECQDNLRQLFASLNAYGDNHQTALPKVEESPPRNFAGVYVPILYDAGLLGPQVHLACNETGQSRPTNISLQQLQDLYELDPARFEATVQQLHGCYAYPLGFRSDGQLQGLSTRAFAGNTEFVPVLADRPPFDHPGSPEQMAGNSPNHGGLGQNVLYLGGNVRFAKTRLVGLNGGDIYLNRRHQVGAGVDDRDIPLASGPVHPESVPMPEH